MQTGQRHYLCATIFLSKTNGKMRYDKKIKNERVIQSVTMLFISLKWEVLN